MNNLHAVLVLQSWIIFLDWSSVDWSPVTIGNCVLSNCSAIFTTRSFSFASWTISFRFASSNTIPFHCTQGWGCERLLEIETEISIIFLYLFCCSSGCGLPPLLNMLSIKAFALAVHLAPPTKVIVHGILSPPCGKSPENLLWPETRQIIDPSLFKNSE